MTDEQRAEAIERLTSALRLLGEPQPDEIQDRRSRDEAAFENAVYATDALAEALGYQKA